MLAITKTRLNPVNKILLTIAICFVSVSRLSYGGSIARTMIPFKGTANGGTLIIGSTSGLRYVRSVSISTAPGETAESVVRRLAEAIAYSNSIYDYSRAGWQVDRPALAESMTRGNALRILAGGWILAGTETGLGIPRTPLFLSCSYHEKSRKFDIRWVNQQDTSEYDSIDIRWSYRNSNANGGGVSCPATSTSYTIERAADVNDLDMDVWLTILRNEMPRDIMIAKSIPLNTNFVPSGVVAIRITGNGYCLDETYGIPYPGGIAPNWAPWSTAAKMDKNAFEQGDKYPNLRMYNPNKSLYTKSYYQVINAPPKSEVHGIYRKFLGLTPGHTYRLTACLSTLDMDSIQADWSFSLHATHNGAGRKDLTVQQLAGSAALPDGKRGPQAGRIASYHKGKTTKAAYDIVFSGDKAASEVEDASHITLPADANEITVWVRFSCSDPKGKVGFSGVKFEDITANPNIVSPEGVVNTERQAEIELLQREEKALQRDFEREKEKAKQK